MLEGETHVGLLSFKLGVINDLNSTTSYFSDKCVLIAGVRLLHSCSTRGPPALPVSEICGAM